MYRVDRKQQRGQRSEGALQPRHGDAGSRHQRAAGRVQHHVAAVPPPRPETRQRVIQPGDEG